jgi:hypothetical protein
LLLCHLSPNLHGLIGKKLDANFDELRLIHAEIFVSDSIEAARSSIRAKVTGLAAWHV